MKNSYIFLIVLLVMSCNSGAEKKPEIQDIENTTIKLTKTSLVVLGNVQDAGSPHIACRKTCCQDLFENPDPKRKVVSLGLFDQPNAKKYLFEASPDIVSQSKILKQITNSSQELADGIFLTHAHIGHYTGLMYLGKEATNAKEVPVYAMPKMYSFLEHNGPWSQLVSTNNIKLNELENRKEILLSEAIKVIPFLVPHRDEFSETVGYKIIGPNKTALFIPDIDKWSKWSTKIEDEISAVDFAFLDATFFSGEEINTRDISQIPHPFIIESMERFENLPSSEKEKIYFIHFNHTNPALNENSKEYQEVIDKGFNIARFLDVFEL